MDVAHQGLAPGVEHRRHAELPIQALGIGAEGRQGRPDGLEEQIVELLGVHFDPAVEDIGQGEDQVMIGDRQDRGALALAPGERGQALAARAVAIATGVVEERRLAAAVAFEEQAAEGLGAAGADVMTPLCQASCRLHLVEL